MSADYRQADLDEARGIVADLTSKEYERIAQALAARERKAADRIAAERDLHLVHDRREVAGG